MDDSPIYIHLASDRPTAVSGSHLFGCPELPADVSIPTVTVDGDDYLLSLVCQINLADLPENDVFPKQGLLQFYADIAYEGSDWDEPIIFMYPRYNLPCRVLYVPLPQLESVASQRNHNEAQGIPTIPITFDSMLPACESHSLQLLGTSAQFGLSSWPHPCEKWQLLLQMDSMEGDGYSFNFVNNGILCFLIRPQDLKRHDFTNVRAMLIHARYCQNKSVENQL